MRKKEGETEKAVKRKKKKKEKERVMDKWTDRKRRKARWGREREG